MPLTDVGQAQKRLFHRMHIYTGTETATVTD